MAHQCWNQQRWRVLFATRWSLSFFLFIHLSCVPLSSLVQSIVNSDPQSSKAAVTLLWLTFLTWYETSQCNMFTKYIWFNNSRWPIWYETYNMVQTLVIYILTYWWSLMGRCLRFCVQKTHFQQHFKSDTLQVIHAICNCKIWTQGA